MLARDFGEGDSERGETTRCTSRLLCAHLISRYCSLWRRGRFGGRRGCNPEKEVVHVDPTSKAARKV
jgi:hypothetical protein